MKNRMLLLIIMVVAMAVLTTSVCYGQTGESVPGTKRLPPRGAELLAKVEAERKARTDKYRDKIEFIRNNPNDPGREKVIDSILDACMWDDLEGKEAAYVLWEKNKYEMACGKFEWLYLDRAVSAYRGSGHDLDKAIQCLRDTIDILKTKDLDFGRYTRGSVFINTPEAKEAVIEDLEKQICEIEERKAGRMPERFVYPWETQVEGRTAEQKVQAKEAREAIKRGDRDAAIRIFEGLGDRESAASTLWGKLTGDSPEEEFRAADEVLQKYPDTKVAGLALYEKAQLFGKAGREEEYVKALEELVSKYPDSERYFEALLGLAGAMESAGRTDEAVKYYLQLIEIGRKTNEFFIWPYDSLSMLYTKRGEYEKADKLLSDAIAAIENGELKVGDTKLKKVDAIQALRAQQQSIKEMNH